MGEKMCTTKMLITIQQIMFPTVTLLHSRHMVSISSPPIQEASSVFKKLKQVRMPTI